MLTNNGWMNMHNYYLCMKVIKLYKTAKKSEEKIFRWGDYRADLVLFRGWWGLFWKYKTFCVGLYSVNQAWNNFFVIIPNCRFILIKNLRNSLIFNTLHFCLYSLFCINIHYFYSVKHQNLLQIAWPKIIYHIYSCINIHV